MVTHHEFIFYIVISFINLVCGDKIMNIKNCFSCKIEKPIDQFYKGHRSCMICRQKINKEHRLNNKEKYSERTYKKNNSEIGFLNKKLSTLFAPSIIKTRGFTPECTKEEIKKYFYEYVEKYGRNCFYCREPWTYISTKHNIGNGRGLPKGTHLKKYIKNLSFDRLNSSKTYTIDNLVFCCTECNLSKKDISFKMIRRLYEIITERNL